MRWFAAGALASVALAATLGYLWLCFGGEHDPLLSW